MKVLRIGHRGSKGYVAENTLESINHAILLGVDGIEIDIFKCLSGELVLSHENSLKRLTGKSGQLEKLTLDDLKEFLVFGKYKIPTLINVLTEIRKPLFVNIELKGLNTAETTSQIIADLSQSTSWSSENFIISSFNWGELEQFRSFDEDTPVGVLVNKSMSMNEAIEFGKKINAHAIHPNFTLLNKKTVKKIRNNGFKIYTWTVNNKDDINFMKKLKVDGIISDFPDKI
ncbi:MAG: glycerophosphodiester phosphodiesterase [Candidatus Marinimicrobia bacterium]|nr:glycerophosphodiester phosphodiesterase [Candidatus Neomarinimicrobiota bacterium]